MDIAIMRTHFDYMFYTDRLVWQYIEALSETQFDAPNDYSLGSVHEQVVHIMSVQEVWLGRIRGQQKPIATAADFPTRALIRSAWDAIEQQWRDYLFRLTETEMYRLIVARTSRGEVYEERVWEVLLHLVNHSTDHRAQLLAAIHRVGGETIAQDWLFYARKTRTQS